MLLSMHHVFPSLYKKVTDSDTLKAANSNKYLVFYVRKAHSSRLNKWQLCLIRLLWCKIYFKSLYLQEIKGRDNLYLQLTKGRDCLYP